MTGFRNVLRRVIISVSGPDYYPRAHARIDVSDGLNDLHDDLDSARNSSAWFLDYRDSRCFQ